MSFLTFETINRQLAEEREPESTLGNFYPHWPEYLMEAAEVALYLFLTCVFASLLLYPASPVRHVALRALMGLAMGGTVIAIVISPWGKRSGGHLHPALT